MKTKKAPVMAPKDAGPDRPPLWEMSPAEIVEAFPKAYEKPVSQYTMQELVALKVYGPATIGGELYLASQQAAAVSLSGALGPAILSKGFTPVPFVSHVSGEQGDTPREAA